MLQPKKPTTPEHFYRETKSSAQGRPRSFVTRPWYGRSWNMPVSSRTRYLTTTYRNWRWCSIEQLAWSSQIIDLPAASHLCCNSSSGPPCKSAEHRQRCTWCIELSAALWISHQATWHQHYQWEAITWSFWYHMPELWPTRGPSSQTPSKCGTALPRQ